MNLQQLIALGGMVGPILYTLIWILGGILQPGYSHIRDDVSSLMAVGAPNKRLFDIMQLIDRSVRIMIDLLIRVARDVRKEIPPDMIKAVDLEAEISFIAFSIGVSIDLEQIKS